MFNVAFVNGEKRVREKMCNIAQNADTKTDTITKRIFAYCELANNI